MDLIRTLEPSDWDWVSALSVANETETGPLTRDAFLKMIEQSFCATAFRDQGGFLISFDQDSDYDSPNFLWFKARYPAFVYVDRIVVSESMRNRKVGGALYEDLFEEAYTAHYDKVVCEVNFDPPNPLSDVFHKRHGFDEVGRAKLANGKTVRYLLRSLTGKA